MIRKESNDPQTNVKPRHGPSFAFGALVVLVAGGLFGVLASVQKSMESRALERAAVHERAADAPEVPLADVARAVREMKLVTVAIETSVHVNVSDTSWRGDVSAGVEVPVRLLYGADLSNVANGKSSIAYNPLTRAYIVRVPVPERIATEVFPTQERTEVTTGWARLRSRAGEYFLGLARTRVADQARAMTLSNEDAEKVRAATREQVGAMVRKFVGPDREVIVRVAEAE